MIVDIINTNKIFSIVFYFISFKFEIVFNYFLNTLKKKIQLLVFKSQSFRLKKIISFRFKHDFLIIRFHYAINMSFRILKMKSTNQEKNIQYNDEIILLMSFKIKSNVKILYNYLIVIKSYLIFFTTSIKSIFIKIEILKRPR